MKKLFTVFLALSILLMPITANASETNTNIEYIGDGIYLETYIEDTEISTFAANTITKTKVGNYKNDAGTLLYTIKVTGTFTYNGTTSTCTSSSVTATTYVSDWKVISKSASKSGNKATATAIFSQYLNGHLIQSKMPTITLTCSATGVLS